MKIDSRFKLQNVAGERLLLLQGKVDGDMTKVISFNESAVEMWNALQNRDFEVADAAQVLLDNYDVSQEVALKDAQGWVDILKEKGVISE